MSNGNPPTWYDPFTGFLGGGPLPFLPQPVPIEPGPEIGGPVVGEPLGGPVEQGNFAAWCDPFGNGYIQDASLPPQSPLDKKICGPCSYGIALNGLNAQCKPVATPPVPATPQPECKPDLRVEICNWPTTIGQPPPPPPPPPKPTPPQPTEPTPPKPTEPASQPAPINAGQISTCDQIDQWASQYQQKTVDGILNDFGVIDNTGQIPALSNIADTWKEFPIVGEMLSDVWRAGITLITSPIKAWIAIQSLVLSKTCDRVGALTQIAAWRGALTWGRRLLGIETRQIETVFHNWENYICPVNVPSVIDADIARRTEDISKEEWRCWVRLNGFDETVHERVYNSHRLQLTPFEIIQLWRRKKVNDADVPKLLSQAGMISTDDQMRLKDVTEFVPPVTDLIRFTARALGDQALVQRFKLMEGFDELYQGKLKDWGQANGISDETMQYYFAGTRQIPAPGQLYTMLQRLRPDNVPPGIDPDDWITTTADLDRALREQHYSPFWWSRLQAISYIPLGIRQLRKAYTEGAMQNEQILPRLKDLGYSGFDATEYLSTLEIERRDVIRKHPITKLYQDAALNRQDASQRLQQEGYLEQEVNDALDFAFQEFVDLSRKKCVEGFKKRYECGEFDQGQLQQQLSDTGLDENQIVYLTARWDCERKSCGKQVAASQLCSWMDSGLITSQEYYQRLKNVGYTDLDARNIVAECNIKLETRQLAQRERAAKEQLRQLQQSAKRVQAADRQALAVAARQARELRALQRQAASDQARANRQSVAATDRANRIRSAILRQQSSQAGKIRVREAMLAKAAEVWAIASGHELPLAVTEVHQALEAVRTMPDSNADQAIRATVQAALSAKRAKTVDLIQAAREIALAMQEYAAVATASVCESNESGCNAQQGNGGNAVLASTTEPNVRPVEPSFGSR